MSQPRMFPAEHTHHSIGRFTEGRFFTPPISTIIDAFLFIVWKNAQRYDIGIAGWVVMGNHPHLAVFDRDPRRASNVPKFRRQVHSQFAKFLKAYWSIDIERLIGTDCVSQLFPVIDDARVLSSLVYIITNPVAGDIVKHAFEMPTGSVSLPWMLDEPLVVKRPSFWFAKRTWPEEIEIQLEVPPTVSATPAEWRSRLEAEIEAEEKRLEEQRKADGTVLKGLEHAKNLTPHDKGKVVKNKKHVLFSGSDAGLNARQYLRNRRFLRGYRKAVAEVLEGNPDVTFPYGTGQRCSSHGFRMYMPPG